MKQTSEINQQQWLVLAYDKFFSFDFYTGCEITKVKNVLKAVKKSCVFIICVRMALKN